MIESLESRAKKLEKKAKQKPLEKVEFIVKLIEPIQNNPLHFVETDMASNESRTVTAEELGIEPWIDSPFVVTEQKKANPPAIPQNLSEGAGENP
jgi:hypothetical protein